MKTHDISRAWSSIDRASTILQAGVPREVLERLADGDPLELEPLCRRHVQDEGYLLNVVALVMRTMARVSYAALDYHGEAPEQWLRDRLLEAVCDLRDRQIGEEMRGVPLQLSREADFYRNFADAAGVPYRRARWTCIVLNNLARPVRQAYYATVVERKSINRCTAEGLGPPSVVRQRLRAADGAVRRALRGTPPPEVHCHGSAESEA